MDHEEARRKHVAGRLLGFSIKRKRRDVLGKVGEREKLLRLLPLTKLGLNIT